jgi:hypothetical protein
MFVGDPSTVDGTLCQIGLTRRKRSGQNQQLFHFGSEEAASGWMYVSQSGVPFPPGTDHKNLSVSSEAGKRVLTARSAVYSISTERGFWCH